VPSAAVAAGSVASQATVAAFGQVNRRTLEDLVLDEVIVRKEDRRVSGSKIFVANRAAATMGLSVKFLGSKYSLG
jgi:mevalonate pyrophosphate decarboxylase